MWRFKVWWSKMTTPNCKECHVHPVIDGWGMCAECNADWKAELREKLRSKHNEL